MKPFLLFLICLLPTSQWAAAEVVILNPKTAGFLRIETVEAEEGTFEETATVIGAIRAIPQNVAVLSTRIAGRIMRMEAFPGDSVKGGEVLLEIESRQPGSPPPVIALAAPRDGIITAAEVRPGEPVEPDKALMEITELREVDVVVKLPLHLAGKVGPGSKARVRTPATGPEIREATFVRFAEKSDERASTLDAIFRIANESLTLRPGMRVEAALILSQRAEVLRIPRAALQGDALEPYVFVKHFDLPHAYQRTVVEPGEMNDQFVEVKNGLFPADEVVTHGAYPLSQAAGKGGLSLKEALDAAHGHEHAEDGSELSPDELAARAKPTAGEAEGGPTGPWKWISFSLFFLWIATLAGRFLPRSQST